MAVLGAAVVLVVVVVVCSVCSCLMSRPRLQLEKQGVALMV